MGAARGMAFEWSALRQFRGSHVARLVGLKPMMIHTDRERSTRSASANDWKVKCAGRTLASKASGFLREVWIETYRLPPILEREPGRVRGLCGKQTVPLAACDSGSPRSAILGRSS